MLGEGWLQWVHGRITVVTPRVSKALSRLELPPFFREALRSEQSSIVLRIRSSSLLLSFRALRARERVEADQRMISPNCQRTFRPSRTGRRFHHLASRAADRGGEWWVVSGGVVRLPSCTPRSALCLLPSSPPHLLTSTSHHRLPPLPPTYPPPPAETSPGRSGTSAPGRADRKPAKRT